jgi:hypothetical protein
MQVSKTAMRPVRRRQVYYTGLACILQLWLYLTSQWGGLAVKYSPAMLEAQGQA